MRQEKTDLHDFLKPNTFGICGILFSCVNSSHRFSVGEYETYRQDRYNRLKDGVLTLVIKCLLIYRDSEPR